MKTTTSTILILIVILLMFIVGCGGRLHPPYNMARSDAELQVHRCRQECGWYSGDHVNLLSQFNCVNKCLELQGWNRD